jgi:hypothetical protein
MLGPPLLHRVVVRIRPARPAAHVQRERVDDRPAAGVTVKVVEPAQHRLAVRDARRRASIAGAGFAGHRIRRAEHAAGPPLRPGLRRLQPLLDGQPDPAAEVSGLLPRRAVPGDPQPRRGTATTAAGPTRTSAVLPWTAPSPAARAGTPTRARRAAGSGPPAGTASACHRWQPGHLLGTRPAPKDPVPTLIRSSGQASGGPQGNRATCRNSVTQRRPVLHLPQHWPWAGPWSAPWRNVFRAATGPPLTA